MTLLAATPAPATAGSPFSGSRILSDGQAIGSALKNGDWLDGGIAFLQGLGDLAAAAADPIGTLVKCGLGWVMGHLGPLSTWLNALAGSQSAVQSVAGQWTSAGSTMRNAGMTLATRLKDLEGLEGKTVDAYRAFASDAAAHISASGDWADGVSQALGDAGQLVAKMQSVVKTGISDVMATAIEAMAVVAATWGLGMGYAIARVVTKVNQVVNKVVKPILQVLQSVKSLVTMVQSIHQLFDSTKELVSGMLNGQPANAVIAAPAVADLTATNLLTNTATVKLQDAGLEADAGMKDLLGSVSVDGPIASGTVDMSGLGAAAGNAGVSAAGGAAAGSGGGAAAHLGSAGLGGAGGVGSVNAATTTAGSMLGGTALSASRVAGGGGAASGASGTGMMAPARAGAAGAEGMGARSGRRKRLTVDIVPDAAEPGEQDA